MKPRVFENNNTHGSFIPLNENKILVEIRLYHKIILLHTVKSALNLEMY